VDLVEVHPFGVTRAAQFDKLGSSRDLRYDCWAVGVHAAIVANPRQRRKSTAMATALALPRRKRIDR
jgi:hypothetical protein